MRIPDPQHWGWLTPLPMCTYELERPVVGLEQEVLGPYVEVEDGGGVEVGEGGQQLHHVPAHRRLRVGGCLAQPHQQGVSADAGIKEKGVLCETQMEKECLLRKFFLEILC